MTPRATYRLQFNAGFTFADAAAQADYLARLGISHVYASPILTARAGSLHGYDVVDHGRVNPELGGEAGLRELVRTLRRHDMGLIVDIVPNHMAVGHADNGWWLDVLERGRTSPHAKAFDIDWEAPALAGRLLAPFLGASPEELLQQNQLRLVRDPLLGKICFAYFDHRFPLRPEDQQALRGADLSSLAPDRLLELLSRQHYLLCDWRQADRRINWRRFFDITELAALRMEEPAVFEAVHARIFALYGQGLIDGLRVDHIDGLADPRAYCRQLRARLAALQAQRGETAVAPYIVVEKILAPHEELPAEWQVDGTTGYDFMNQVSALQHADDGGALDALWRLYGRRGSDFETEELSARREILSSRLAAQFDALVRAFVGVVPDTGGGTLREALTALLVHLRCYRTYATGTADSPVPGAAFDDAVRGVLAATPQLDPAIAAIGKIFHARDDDPAKITAIRRFNQLAAPCAAKAVEDTAFYRYGRLLSRNDVGFDPRQHCIATDTFHGLMRQRARTLPLAMLATATHDHKRGEDARARLAVISEIPTCWRENVERFVTQPATMRPAGLDSGDEYQLYQTLLGLWPQKGALDPAALVPRLERWCEKFLREGKLRSSWQSPDIAYEGKLKAFARALLEDGRAASFRDGMDTLLKRIAPAASANSIVQVVLRCTLPGVPDLYQGCEYGDFSLVDPDNRGAVDFPARRRSLEGGLSGARPDDRAKQAVIAALLQARRNHADLFRFADYRPLAVSGERAAHALAFERRHGPTSLVVIVALHSARLAQHETSNGLWGNTMVQLGPDAGRQYRELLTDRQLHLAADMPIAKLLERGPACVLLAAERPHAASTV